MPEPCSQYNEGLRCDPSQCLSKHICSICGNLHPAAACGNHSLSTPVLTPIYGEITLDTFKQRVSNRQLQAPAVSTDDWALIEDFYAELGKIKRECCDVCNEEGFEMRLRKDSDTPICQRCFKDRSSHPLGPDLYSADNNMDPGPIPEGLPELSIAGQALIARVHAVVNCSRVKGIQYKYSGNVINFPQNTPKLVSKLPSLPCELQSLVLKPSSTGQGNSVIRQFKSQHRVKRREIQTWLEYLIGHHPDYQDCFIDPERLSQLPEDDSIWDQLPTVIDDDVDDVQDQGAAIPANGKWPVFPIQVTVYYTIHQDMKYSFPSQMCPCSGEGDLPYPFLIAVGVGVAVVDNRLNFNFFPSEIF